MINLLALILILKNFKIWLNYVMVVMMTLTNENGFYNSHCLCTLTVGGLLTGTWGLSSNFYQTEKRKHGQDINR